MLHDKTNDRCDWPVISCVQFCRVWRCIWAEIKQNAYNFAEDRLILSHSWYYLSLLAELTQTGIKISDLIYLGSFRVESHSLTPFSVDREMLLVFPGQFHPSQILANGIHPVLSWSTWIKIGVENLRSFSNTSLDRRNDTQYAPS